MTSSYGPNTFADSAQYDVLFKDILVNSEQRNIVTFPIPNNYRVKFLQINQLVFKAELIEVYVPSATDTAVYVDSNNNRLYFSYDYSGGNVYGYIVIQCGSYLSPQSLGRELQRQFDIFFDNTITNTYGINVGYNVNLNRYIFTDKTPEQLNTITLYLRGETFLSGAVITNSIQNSLKLYSDPALKVSNPIIIIKNDTTGITKPEISTTGSFGVYNINGTPGNIPLNKDSVFSNAIVSDIVLTNCKLFLSLGSLDPSNSTLSFTTREAGTENLVPANVFCQIPNNSPVSSASVKTMLNQPSFYSSTQFYNPAINQIDNFVVNWYDEYGNALNNIMEHCFTIRIYYFQKNNRNTLNAIPQTSGFGSAGSSTW